MHCGVAWRPGRSHGPFLAPPESEVERRGKVLAFAEGPRVKAERKARQTYRVLILCPDRHLVYDGHTPDRVGVGGGVTARIRMAQALARLGHQVTVLANCPQRTVIHAVEYLPLEATPPREVDVFIANTTGGDLDISLALSLPVGARLSLVWLGGKPKPKGIDALRFDYLYVVSNFLRDHVVSSWGVEERRVFVAYNGVEESLFLEARAKAAARDDFRIAYLGHPSKGLEAAIGVLKRLRRRDPRYSLHVFGGPALWGGEDSDVPEEPGVVYHGLLGQRELVANLVQCGFALHLQRIEEAFGIAVAESLRAGCITLASPVGAIPELIRHGRDGFLVPGDPRASSTQDRAASLIWLLSQRPDYLQYVRENASKFPWNWDRMALVWVGHWDWALDRERSAVEGVPCPVCDGALLLLADGAHCRACGRYFAELPCLDEEPRLSARSPASRESDPEGWGGAATKDSMTNLRDLFGRLRQVTRFKPRRSPGSRMRQSLNRFGLLISNHARRLVPPLARRIASRGLQASFRLLKPTEIRRWREAVSAILARYSDVRDVFVFLPSLEWEGQLFQRPQQLARALARRGALVLYVEAGGWGRKRGIAEVEERLFVCRLPLEVFAVAEDPVVYTLTWNAHLVDAISASRVLYDYVDALDAFEGVSKRDLQKWHADLLVRAALVLTSAHVLWEDVRRLRRNGVVLCPNGVDLAHFSRARRRDEGPPPADLVELVQRRQPLVGYHGALARWFDYDLVAAVSKVRADLQFLLIGPDHDGSLVRSGLLSLPNVHWLGVKTYEELPNYLRYIDVGVIPFRLNEISHAASPIKLFEYMAAGKPVIVTPMAESLRYREHVLVASTPSQFSRQLDRALDLSRDPNFQEVLLRVASENTWEARADLILLNLGRESVLSEV